MSGVVTDVATSGRRRGLIAVITSVTLVGIMISAVAPLLSLNLEQRGVSAAWNGLLAATPPLASLIFGAFMPMIIRRIGAAPSIYWGAGISAGGSMLGIGAATCTVPRCAGVFEMRIFIPFSEEISIESTEDPSSMSSSFLT